MKKVLTLMLGLVAGTASFANTSTTRTSVAQAHLVMTADRKIKLYVQPLQAKGELAILDANGQAIYDTNVSLQKGFRQQFDFSSLPVGNYQLVLTTGQQVVAKTFVVQANPNQSFVVQEP